VDKKDSKTIQRPELEATLRADGREIAVVAFFKDAYGGYDVLVGLENLDQRLLVANAFGSCENAVKEAATVELSPNETPPIRKPAK